MTSGFYSGNFLAVPAPTKNITRLFFCPSKRIKFFPFTVDCLFLRSHNWHRNPTPFPGIKTPPLPFAMFSYDLARACAQRTQSFFLSLTFHARFIIPSSCCGTIASDHPNLPDCASYARSPNPGGCRPHGSLSLLMSMSLSALRVRCRRHISFS